MPIVLVIVSGYKPSNCGVYAVSEVRVALSLSQVVQSIWGLLARWSLDQRLVIPTCTF